MIGKSQVWLEQRKYTILNTSEFSPSKTEIMRNKKSYFSAILLLIVVGILSLHPTVAAAVTLTPTGFITACSASTTGTASLAACIKGIYTLSLGLGALLALLMIVLAGYRYMTAQGNSQQVENAKDSFTSAFIGLIIIFVAFILLFLINPDLTSFSDLPIPPIPAQPVSTATSTSPGGGGGAGAACTPAAGSCATGLVCNVTIASSASCTCVAGTGQGSCGNTGAPPLPVCTTNLDCIFPDTCVNGVCASG